MDCGLVERRGLPQTSVETIPVFVGRNEEPGLQAALLGNVRGGL